MINCGYIIMEGWRDNFNVLLPLPSEQVFACINITEHFTSEMEKINVTSSYDAPTMALHLPLHLAVEVKLWLFFHSVIG